MAEKNCCKKTSIGGQAVIEGIMMKGPNKTALCVRLPDGEIDTEYIKEKHAKDKFKILGMPVIRGAVNFIEALITGYSALMKSAEKSGMTDEVKEEADEKKANRILNIVMVVASVLGVALAVVLFMYLPALAFDFTNKALGSAFTAYKAVFEGILKLIIFLIYMFIVSKTPDIKRVFSYHGAEHKTIFCYESGAELTVENVKKQSRFHPRCGTSFMILMLIVGILIGMAATWLFPVLTKSGMRPIWVVCKILILPLVCGVGYELLKFCGRHDNIVTRIIAAPGMWMQRLTTNEPDDSMIEVAIVSLKAVLPENSEEDNW